LVVPPSGPFADRRFSDLLSLVPPGDLVVLNSTKVRRARLHGTGPGGGKVEVLLVHPEPDGTWIAMGKPGSAFRVGRRITLGGGIAIETVALGEGPNRLIRFVGGTAEQAMERFGQIPLPPYITRDAEAADFDRYQTVYAVRDSSVAAPTAGLHFTHSLLNALRGGGVQIEHLELEVGPGTFRPVQTDDPAEHRMHPERYTISESLARAAAATRAAGRRVWAVGTTVVRALESATNGHGRLTVGDATTDLLILPGHRFRIVDRLITNFHLPRSTLLMLVSAFSSTERIREAYRHAVAARYRFYSYGDAMLVLP
jgi:S-adenosylmethionine:tRNA ribosyltransferase-isomerase